MKKEKMTLKQLKVSSFTTLLDHPAEKHALIGQSPVPTIAKSNIVC